MYGHLYPCLPCRKVNITRSGLKKIYKFLRPYKETNILNQISENLYNQTYKTKSPIMARNVHLSPCSWIPKDSGSWAWPVLDEPKFWAIMYTSVVVFECLNEIDICGSTHWTFILTWRPTSSEPNLENPNLYIKKVKSNPTWAELDPAQPQLVKSFDWSELCPKFIL